VRRLGGACEGAHKSATFFRPGVARSRWKRDRHRLDASAGFVKLRFRGQKNAQKSRAKKQIEEDAMAVVGTVTTPMSDDEVAGNCGAP
jgi:hypothetical protein